MSQIVRGISSLRSEWKQLQQKKIKKQKKKNEHFQSFKFDDRVPSDSLKSQMLLVVQKLPQTIPNNNIFRLKTNIQFSLNINKENQLGSLFIDPHSNNYKIARLEKRKHLVIITLDSIERPTTPPENIYKIFQQRNEQLAQAFRTFNERNLETQKLKLNTIDEMKEFENNIKHKPYACYVHIYCDGLWKTFQKIYNEQMLKVLAITEEMLFHYCNETQLMPVSAFFDSSDDQMNVLIKIFNGITNQDSTYRDYMNFNGQKFTAKLTVRSFFIFDEETNQMFDYQFSITDCEQKWMDEDRVYLNQLEYFNIKPASVSTDQSFFQDNQRRCGYKEIEQ